MAERIVITDPKVKALEERCIRKLEEYYPDHVIKRSVDSEHKKLGERLGKARKLIGYKTRSDMLLAWGFKAIASKGGRPVTFDAEALMAELAKRYEGKKKPDSFGELVEENPDLKGKLKTASNMSTEAYGRTLSNELRARGLLTGRAKKDLSPEDVQQQLRELIEKYSSVRDSDKPGTFVELKAQNPDYADLFKTVSRDKFVSLGVINEGNRYSKKRRHHQLENVSDNELLDAVRKAGRELCDMLPADKPKTTAALNREFPEFGAFVNEAEKRGLVTKELLCKMGVLNPGLKYLKKYGIRLASKEELFPAAADALGVSCISPAEPLAASLPPYVDGIDLEHEIELEIALAMMPIGWQRMNIGDSFKGEIKWVPAPDDSAFETAYAANTCSKPVTLPMKIDVLELCNDSVLTEFVGAKVVSISEYAGERVAQFELRYLAPLAVDTLIFMLRKKGIVKDSDLAGGMGWRYRLGLNDFGTDANAPSQKPMALSSDVSEKKG